MLGFFLRSHYLYFWIILFNIYTLHLSLSPTPPVSNSSVLSLFFVGSGGGKELVTEPGGAGAAAGFSHQHGGHPADGESKAADGGARVQEGAGRPADAAGRPGPEDPQPQTETQRPGRDGRQTISIIHVFQMHQEF